MPDNRMILQRELDEVKIQISALAKTLEERPDYGLGKGSPAVVRREVDRALLRRLRRRAESLEQALSRLSSGLYGICTQCGGPIHPERLMVMPDAESCIDCAQRSGSERNALDATMATRKGAKLE